MAASSFVYDIWYFAGLSGDVKSGKLIRIDIAGEPITLGRKQDGTLFALRDICPHRAAPLSAGRIINDTVECPYHGWRFGGDGLCKAMPALPLDSDINPETVRVRTYPLREVGQLIWIYLASETKRGTAPSVEPPQIEKATGKVFIDEQMIMNTHIDQAALGLIDPAHGPYVHQQWWWRSDHKMKDKEKAFEPRPLGFAMAAHSPSSNSFAYKLLGGKPVTEITFNLPGVRTEDIRVGDKSLLSLTAMTPIDSERTLFRQIFFTNMTTMRLIKPIFRAGVRRFLKQDSGILELQRQGLEYGTKQMFIGDADAQARWYFAMKKEWVAANEEGRDFVHPVKNQVLKYRT